MSNHIIQDEESKPDETSIMCEVLVNNSVYTVTSKQRELDLLGSFNVF
jgi:hypothetical protein